ncbi:MAG: 30S ribosomal protein S4 [Clostridia bacterium]|nr:30S ribosomal protein S4 [Clostridia bacterium]
MARYTDAVCRLCRREGQKLFLKGDRCYSDKCAIARREYAPGQHGQGRKKISEYGLQLREKQKVKRYYGIAEKQFAHYFELASKKSGIVGENLLTLCESRLDNVCYRAGFGMSRPEARQLVRHGHFTVNGKKVNIPSYIIKEGDVIALADKSKDSPKIKAILEANEGKSVPAWLQLDSNAHSVTVLNLAKREDIEYEINETLIVELYSK